MAIKTTLFEPEKYFTELDAQARLVANAVHSDDPQFLIDVAAVVEKGSALENADFSQKCAARADYEWFDRIMNREGGEPPREGDELPEGYVRTKL